MKNRIIKLEVELKENEKQIKVAQALPGNNDKSIRLLLLKRSRIKDELLQEYRVYVS